MLPVSSSHAVIKSMYPCAAKSISANGVNVVTVVPAASAEAAATNRQINAIKPEILLRIAKNLLEL